MRQIGSIILLSYAEGFGTGRLWKMPGTWGTIPGVVLAFLLQQTTILTSALLYCFLVIIAFYAAEAKGRVMEDWDHPSIVCDEIIGVIPMLWYVPFSWHWVWLFVLFRALDIMKPQPIAWVDQHIHGPLGCLLDDLLAGFLGLMVAVYCF